MHNMRQAKACGYNSDIRDIVSGWGMTEYIEQHLIDDSPCLGLFGSLAGNGYFAGSDELFYAHGLEEFDERLYLFFVAGNFYRIGILAGIYDPPSKNIGEPQNLRLVLLFRGNLNQHHFPFDMGKLCHVDYFNNIYQFIELFVDLLDNLVVAARNNGHRRYLRVYGLPNREALDIISPAAEEA